MPHRDALVAARERIVALERELAESRQRSGETTSETIERLSEEKRALQADRARLVVERDRLVDELSAARHALARAEEASASVRRELEHALAIRDQLRRQAIEGASRAGEARRGARASELPPAAVEAARAVDRAPESTRGEARRETSTLTAHNLARPRVTVPAGKLAGVACDACRARGEHIEMITTGATHVFGERAMVSVGCPRCGAAAMKLD